MAYHPPMPSDSLALTTLVVVAGRGAQAKGDGIRWDQVR